MLGILAIQLRINFLRFNTAKGSRIGAGELRFADGKLPHSQLVTLCHQLCLVHLDLKAVGAAAVTGGGDEHTGCAVFVLDISRDIVFHLNIMPLAILHMGMDLDGHAADPLPQIQLVGALVHQNTATLTGPGGPPIAGIVISLGAIPVGDEPVGTADLAVLAGLDQLTHFPVDGVGSLVEHHAEYHIVFLGFLVHPAHLLGIHTGRFFHQHMDPLFHAGHGILGMIVVGNRNNAGIDHSAAKHLLCGFKIRDIGAQILLCPRDTLWIVITDGSQYKVRTFSRQDRLGILGTLIANTQNTQSDFFHNVPP